MSGDQSHFRDRFFILVICIDYSLELNLAIYQNSFSFWSIAIFSVNSQYPFKL